MSNEFFKTISLQELYSMLCSYQTMFVSCFSPSNKCGLSLLVPIKSLAYHNETPVPYLIYNSNATTFILQQKQISITSPVTNGNSLVLNVVADGLTYRLMIS